VLGGDWEDRLETKLMKFVDCGGRSPIVSLVNRKQDGTIE
jgi:hypothetical protein